MSKRHHEYRLTLEHTAQLHPEQPLHEPAAFDFPNHDNLFDILERVQRIDFLSKEEASSLALGVKLLGSVLLTHRDNPLFAELREPLRAFVQQLKAQNQ